MRSWEHGGGFSVDARVRVEAADRAGLERLVRHCARGPLALERLQRDPDEPEGLLYHLPKPSREGRLTLTLTPLEILSRLAALLPPPRVHRHRYAGVLAPHSPWRASVTAWAEAGAETERVASPSPSAQPVDVSATPVPRSPARYPWAMLLARLYEAFPLACPVCRAQMRLIAFVTDGASITRSLRFALRLCLAAQGTPSLACPLDGAKVHRSFAAAPSRPCAPRRADAAPAAVPRAWAAGVAGMLEQSPVSDPTAPDPVPEYEFDQRVSG